MAYKGWKLMEKVDVAIRDSKYSSAFTGYVAEHGDKKALDSAKSWARIRDYSKDSLDKSAYTEGEVHTFDNEGFTAKILASAGGSSQGGRLSFWQCAIEKDGVSFSVGVNDSMLADLIKNSDISNGVIKQKVMFARNSGSAGLIHEGMDSYKEAVKDMESKNTFKKAKKTSKWEIGGVYSTLTKTSVSIGKVWDTLEEYQEKENRFYGGSKMVTKFRKSEKRVLVDAWVDIWGWNSKEDTLDSLAKAVEDGYIYTGKPPARAHIKTLEVTDEALKTIDKKLKLKQEYRWNYKETEEITGRYVRPLKK